MRLFSLFPEVIKVLKYVEKEALDGRNRNQATGILSYFKKFEFAFYSHLMEHILGITDLLSRSLQKRDQNIVEAVSMIKGTKQALVRLRTSGFDAFLKIVNSFCEKHDIVVLNMDKICVAKRNRVAGIKNRHYFEIDIFNTVLDMQIQEFGDRFGEISTDLLINMSALSPCDSFTMFDASKIITLTTFYQDDFTDADRFSLRRELDLYYETVIHDIDFMKLKGIAELATLMVTRKKHISFPLIYKLLKLSLVLPVATATVERCFSAMKLIKINLRNNKMGEII